MLWSELKQWERSGASSAAEGLEDDQQAAKSSSERVSGINFGDWTGYSAYAAVEAGGMYAEETLDLYESIQDVRQAILAFANDLNDVVDLVNSASSYASGHGLTIHDDGAVEAPAGTRTEEEQADLQAKVEACATMVGEAFDKAIAADSALSDSVAQIIGRTVIDGYEGTIGGVGEAGAEWPSHIADPSNMSPEEIANWWAGLSEEDQMFLVTHFPRQMATNYGIDLWASDMASRIALSADSERLSELEGRYERAENYDWEGRPFAMIPGGMEDAEWYQLNKDGINDLNNAIRNDSGELRDDITLLGYESAGESGNAVPHAIIGIGDLENATHVNIEVPGTNGYVGNAADSLVGKMDRRMMTTQEYLESLGGDYPNQQHASVLFMGYDAPDEIGFWEDGTRAATNRAWAEQGRDELADFANGFYHQRQASGGADQYVSMTTHSYGAVVGGKAGIDFDDGAVDAMLSYGGAGLGVNNADNINVGTLYGIQNHADIINLSNFGVETHHGWYGRTINADAVTRLPADDTTYEQYVDAGGEGRFRFDQHNNYEWYTEDGELANPISGESMAQVITNTVPDEYVPNRDLED